MPQTFVASAPGSVMLFGEHAVLRGRPAIVAAVAARVTARVAARSDGRLRARSALGALDAPWPAPPAPPPAFRFVQAAALTIAPAISGGLDIEIRSDFPATVGLGSSAAVTVAVLAAARALAGRTTAPDALLAEGRALVRAAQGGVGSGADVAASVFGGLLFYRQTDAAPERLPGLPPITLVYSGYKTPTAEVIRRVNAAAAADPDRFERIFDGIGAAAERGAEAFRRGDFAAAGRAMEEGQARMEELGVCDDTLAQIVRALRATSGILGAKISGSGLGDCALGLGAVTRYDGPGERLPVALSEAGLRVEASAEYPISAC